MTSRSLMPVLLATLAAAPGAARAEARPPVLPATITFDSSPSSSERRIALGAVAADFPRDWTGYEALVLEVRASSPQRIHLRVHTRGGGPGKERFSRVLFHPYPGAWIRAAIPVSLLAKPPATGDDMAAVGNRSRKGYFLGLWGPFAPLVDVEAIGFEMEKPIGSPTLEVRAVRLERESPGDAVLSKPPAVSLPPGGLPFSATETDNIAALPQSPALVALVNDLGIVALLSESSEARRRDRRYQGGGGRARGRRGHAALGPALRRPAGGVALRRSG